MAMANNLIEKLQLVPYPGVTGSPNTCFFKEVYRSKIMVKLLSDDREPRNAFTSIYTLMKAGHIGVWKKLKSDETFFYHKGNSLRIAIIEDCEARVVVLGDSLAEEEAVYQFTAPANCWFNYGVSKTGTEDYGLYGVVVSPGFETVDVVLADTAKLVEQFPQHTKIIEEFTYSSKK